MRHLLTLTVSTLAMTLALTVTVQSEAKSIKAPSQGAPASSNAATTAPTTAASAKFELAVDGMHCESCVENLTTQLESMTDLVERGTVKVDLKGNKASVTLKNAATNDAALKSLQEKLNKTLVSNGFTVTKVKVLN